MWTKRRQNIDTLRSLLILMSLDIAVLGLSKAFAHANHGKEGKKPAATQAGKVFGQDEKAFDSAEPVKLDRIARLYDRDVEPLMRRACGDCHASKAALPWYYDMPGVKQLIDSDIAEARSHLDITEGFPFVSHSSPSEDLKAIQRTIKEGTMPPSRYRWLHSEAELTAAEKDIILKWTEKSINILQGNDQP